LEKDMGGDSWYWIGAQDHGDGAAARNGTPSGWRLAEDPGMGMIWTREQENDNFCKILCNY
jgi:hypothetical protein